MQWFWSPRKYCHCFHFFPIYFPWSELRLNSMILVFWVLSCFFFFKIGVQFYVFYLFIFYIVAVFVIHRHESAMDTHVFPIPIPIPPPTSLSTRSLWVFPVHQVRALVSCIQPGLVICSTMDNICVPMLFSWNVPPTPSPTESKSLFYTSVSLFLFCI